MDKHISYKATKQKYRSPISSADQNKNNEDIMFDLLNLANRNNSIEEKINETTEQLYIESYHRDMTTNEYVNKIRQLENQLVPGEIKTFIAGVDKMYVDGAGVNTAVIDKINNCATIPYSSSTSKAVLVDDINGVTYIPPGLKLTATIINKTGVLSYEDNDSMNALRKDKGIWFAKITTEKDIKQIDMNIDIDLPDTIIDTRDVNTIILNPFPYKGVDIMGVQYKLFGDWNDVPSMASHIDCQSAIVYGEAKNIFKDSGNVMLNFSECLVKSIRVKARSTKPIEENGKNVFYIGFKLIDVLSRRYDQMSGSVYIKADIADKTPAVIHDVSAHINNLGEVQDTSIQYELFSLDENDIPTRLGATPLTVKNGKLLVKCNMSKNRVTPSVPFIKIKYSL